MLRPGRSAPPRVSGAHARRCGAALAAALALASCASTPEGKLALVTGEETDALSRAPAPSALVLEAVDANGKASPLARATLPATSIDLGTRGKEDFFALRVTGVDAAGKALVWGQSLQLQAGALEDRSLPVFVQRTGELARMPTRREGLPADPVTALVAGRYLFVGAADSTAFQLYDLASYTWLEEQPKLPRPPRSLAARGTRVYVIDDQGGSLVDLSSGATTEVKAPSGGSYAEVAGGATVTAEDGSQYVVGPTRAQPESQRALRIERDGGLAFVALTAMRARAAATWIAGRGLLVVGGSATAAGAELAAPGAATAGALPFPPHPGGAAAPLDGARALVVGSGDPQPRTVDVGCARDCAFTPRGAPLPSGAADASRGLEAVEGGVFLFVGRPAAPPGLDAAFLVGEGPVRAVPFRHAGRAGARLVRLDNGAIAAVGGAPVLEAFAPVNP